LAGSCPNRALTGAIENEIGAVVDKRRAVVGPRAPSDHGKRIAAQRLDRMIFGAVDFVAPGAVDDDLRPRAIHRRGNGRAVGDVQIGVSERRHLVRRAAFMDNRGAELAPGAKHGNPHQAAL
jgi:hypothetical protein